MSTATAQSVQDAFPQPSNQSTRRGRYSLESDWHRLAMTLLIELVGFTSWGGKIISWAATCSSISTPKQPRFGISAAPISFLSGRLHSIRRAPTGPSGRGGQVSRCHHRTHFADYRQRGLLRQEDDLRTGFRTSEYFIYDPAERKLQGWRLNGNSRYQDIAIQRPGLVWSRTIGLWLGTWTGKYQGKEEVLPALLRQGWHLIPARWSGRKSSDCVRGPKQRGTLPRLNSETESQAEEAKT